VFCHGFFPVVHKEFGGLLITDSTLLAALPPCQQHHAELKFKFNAVTSPHSFSFIFHLKQEVPEQ
jgi:hypothetical protein